MYHVSTQWKTDKSTNLMRYLAFDSDIKITRLRTSHMDNYDKKKGRSNIKPSNTRVKLRFNSSDAKSGSVWLSKPFPTSDQREISVNQLIFVD